jgi:hypothetical protein
MAAEIIYPQSKPIQKNDGEEILTNEYFRIDFQDRLPLSELKRRAAIKSRLESQFELWAMEEQHRLCTLSLQYLRL